MGEERNTNPHTVRSFSSGGVTITDFLCRSFLGFLKLLSLILSQNENLSIDESRLEDIIQLCEELLEIIWKAVGSSETGEYSCRLFELKKKLT